VVIVDSDGGRLGSQVYAPQRDPGMPVDVLVYTLHERHEWSPRFADEVARGVVLYRR
jgi:hypothetical protein